MVGHHRRGVLGGALAILAGFAVAAFAIAPLAPDASQLPRRLITEAVGTDATTPQLEALAGLSMELRRSTTTRAGDTADGLLARMGVSDPLTQAFIQRDAIAHRMLEGRGGRAVEVRAREDGTLLELTARLPTRDAERQGTHFTRLTLTRGAQGQWSSREDEAELKSQWRMASGTIRTSLFAATDEARIPDAIAVQLAEIFAADVDMHRELRRGDTFSVVYEALTADGEPVTWSQGIGRVVAAEFVNAGKAYQALWYRAPDGRGAYFDAEGQSKKRTFLASPMEFSRVTSGFAMRFHPVSQSWRQHLGVDYAAPAGTPVRSVGDGTVEFAGQQNGYGNVIMVRHGNEQTTLYAHLSRIDVRKGQRVEQGQRIGAVGSTGWATGPHLHFEFRINGHHEDPLRIAKASEAMTLASAYRDDFTQMSAILRSRIAVAGTLAGVSANAE
jgi:murein DD-endopeptidase MepM/ murein hydrolase activator NlpD